MISLQNVDRDHAFMESDQQLLETLAASLSVALENARLVHETRQRNAELALINSVQDSIAGELDQQAIYDLVGDKLRKVSTRRSSNRGVRRQTGILVSGTSSNGASTLEGELPAVGFSKHVWIRANRCDPREYDAASRVAQPGGSHRRASHGSALFVPLAPAVTPRA